MKFRTVLLTLMAVVLSSTAVMAADRYEIDQAHSYIGFSVRHLVISNVKGNFTDFSGIIVFDDKDITKSSVEATIQTTSINTSNASRDDHLRKADFFNVEKFPEMIFETDKIVKSSDGFTLYGYLTMLGKKKEVVIPIEFLGKAKGMRGEDRIGFEGYAKIKRSDYDMKFSAMMETGGLVVGDELKIELQIEAVKAAPTEKAATR